MKFSAIATLLMLVFAAAAARSDSVTTRGSSSVLLDAPTKAKKADAPLPVAVASVLEDDLAGSCTLEAKDRGSARKGVKGTFEAILVDAITGNTISDLAKESGKTGKDGLLTVEYAIPGQGNFAQLVALAVDVSVRGGKKVTALELSCELVDETP